MNEWHIKVEGVTVAYDSFNALEDVSFECVNGEFVVIVGKSGTGKSTFLNALADFIPYKGKINMPKNFGYVFQKYALFPWMTVEKNIEFGLGNLSSTKRHKRVNEMLERIEMQYHAKHYPSNLSGGQVQRVALARALAPNPDVMLMDEPYGALDHHTRDKMQDWLLTMWKETKKTILFVTHYIEEAIFLADRIIIVRDKKFIADITVPFSRPRSNDLRFSEHFLDMKHEVLDYMDDIDKF